MTNKFQIRTDAQFNVHIDYDEDHDIVLYADDEPILALRQEGTLYLFEGVEDHLGLQLADNGTIKVERDSNNEVRH